MMQTVDTSKLSVEHMSKATRVGSYLTMVQSVGRRTIKR